MEPWFSRSPKSQEKQAMPRHASKNMLQGGAGSLGHRLENAMEGHAAAVVCLHPLLVRNACQKCPAGDRKVKNSRHASWYIESQSKCPESSQKRMHKNDPGRRSPCHCLMSKMPVNVKNEKTKMFEPSQTGDACPCLPNNTVSPAMDETKVFQIHSHTKMNVQSLL